MPTVSPQINYTQNAAIEPLRGYFFPFTRTLDVIMINSSTREKGRAKLNEGKFIALPAFYERAE